MKKNNWLKIAVVCVAGAACLSGQFDLKGVDWGQLGKDVIQAARPLNQDEEIALGRQVAARLAGTFGVWKDEAWTEEINIIGRVLVPYSERPDMKYRFAILNTDDVNAYSAPGGYIFISKGMLKQVESEAELAGILGHEIAHVANKDVVREIQKSNLWKTGAKVAISGTELSPEQQELLNNMTNASWDTLVVKGLSKADEFKADQDGTVDARKLGYDSYGLYYFIQRLEPLEKKPGEDLRRLFSTHPKPSERSGRLKQYFDNKGWGKNDLPECKDRLKNFKANHPVP